MRRSVMLALLLAVGLAAWLASGQPAVQRLVTGEPPAAAAAPTVDTSAPPLRALTRVRVLDSEAVSIDREIVVYGRTEAKRDVLLRAETYGRVSELFVTKGAAVVVGEPILRLDTREREAMLAQAEALVSQRELEHEAATKLGARGFQAETQVAAAAADLEAARAELRAREVELENTRVAAPFSGILADRMVEVGDYLDIADPVARVIEVDPFLVTGEVAETQRRLVGLGMLVHVELADGRRCAGRITFISPDADAATRTFRIEVEVAPEGEIVPAGMSATLRLRFDKVMAHRLSAALLTLDTEHRLGVLVVDDDDIVRFAAVDMVRADAEAVWLAGLPATSRVIVVGQGFVHTGERVLPVPVDPGVDLVANRAGEDE